MRLEKTIKQKAELSNSISCRKRCVDGMRGGSVPPITVLQLKAQLKAFERGTI